jgi:hypothetical protein
VRITEKTDFKKNLFVTDKLREKIKNISFEFTKKRRDSRNKCPACEFPEYAYAFEKNGFHYAQCKKCSSLYVKNPISRDHLRRYREKISDLYKEDEVKEILKKLYDKKKFDLEITLNRTFPEPKGVRVGFVDLKYPGFLDELREKIPGFEFEELKLGNNNKYHLIVMDNILEHLYDPVEYLNALNDSMVENGYLYVTSRLGSGIDILMLWENSNLIPTEHLNLFSKEGIDYLFNKIFDLKYISTPGVLDIKMMLESKNIDLPPFLAYLKKHRGDEIIEDFQYFVQKNLLSSYMILLAQKKEIPFENR